jgi:hypothetical protein
MAAVLTWSKLSVPFVYSQACSVTAYLKLVPRPVCSLRYTWLSRMSTGEKKLAATT